MYHSTLNSTEMTTTMSNILRTFPEDTLHYIFQFLPTPSQIKLILTCKALYSIYDKYPANILLGSGYCPLSCLARLQYFMSLESGFQYKTLKFTTKQATEPDLNCKCLVLTANKGLPKKLVKQSSPNDSYSLLNVTRVELSKPVPISSILTVKFENLTSLVIHKFNLNGNIDQILVGTPHLKYLWMEDCTNGNSSDLDLSTMFVGCTNLIELYLVNNLFDIWYLTLPEKLHTLVCYQDIECINASLCKCLEYVEVLSSSSYNLNDGLTFIPPLVPCLRVLKFDCYLGNMGDEYSAFKNLEEFHFYVNYGYFFDFSDMINLRHLSIFLNSCAKMWCKFPPGDGLVSVKLIWGGYNNIVEAFKVQLQHGQPIKMKFSHSE